MAPFGVHVVAIAPGAIRTPLLAKAVDQFDRVADALPAEMRPLYESRLRAFNRTAKLADRLATSPEKASLTILRAVRARVPRAHYLIGQDAGFLAFLKRNLPHRWMDRALLLMLGIPSRIPGHQPAAACSIRLGVQA
jgi:NAD(P)-dependent dehydrogenase (short-subunit alcohol dehydrogenase family)